VHNLPEEAYTLMNLPPAPEKVVLPEADLKLDKQISALKSSLSSHGVFYPDRSFIDASPQLHKSFPASSQLASSSPPAKTDKFNWMEAPSTPAVTPLPASFGTGSFMSNTNGFNFGDNVQFDTSKTLAPMRGERPVMPIHDPGHSKELPMPEWLSSAAAAAEGSVSNITQRLFAKKAAQPMAPFQINADAIAAVAKLQADLAQRPAAAPTPTPTPTTALPPFRFASVTSATPPVAQAAQPIPPVIQTAQPTPPAVQNAQPTTREPTTLAIGSPAFQFNLNFQFPQPKQPENNNPPK